MNLYATGFPDTGFNLDGFVILTVKLVHGEASRYCEVLMGVCLTLDGVSILWKLEGKLLHVAYLVSAAIWVEFL